MLWREFAELQSVIGIMFKLTETIPLYFALGGNLMWKCQKITIIFFHWSTPIIRNLSAKLIFLLADIKHNSYYFNLQSATTVCSIGYHLKSGDDERWWIQFAAAVFDSDSEWPKSDLLNSDLYIYLSPNNNNNNNNYLHCVLCLRRSISIWP